MSEDSIDSAYVPFFCLSCPFVSSLSLPLFMPFYSLSSRLLCYCEHAWSFFLCILIIPGWVGYVGRVGCVVVCVRTLGRVERRGEAIGIGIGIDVCHLNLYSQSKNTQQTNKGETTGT